jgi:hypothetical protein
VKRHELIDHLARHGCYLAREGGRHSIYTNPANGVSAPGASARRDRQPAGAQDLQSAWNRAHPVTEAPPRSVPGGTQTSQRQKPAGAATGSGSNLRTGSRFEMKQKSRFFDVGGKGDSTDGERGRGFHLRLNMGVGSGWQWWIKPVEIVMVHHAYAHSGSSRSSCSDLPRKLKYGSKPQFSRGRTPSKRSLRCGPSPGPVCLLYLLRP